MKLRWLLLFYVFAYDARSQGCSDAGVCTIGTSSNLHNDSIENNTNKLSLMLTSGSGDQSVFIFTPTLQYEKLINKHLSLQTKITANYANGNLGTAIGVGDLSLSGRYSINPTKTLEHSLLLATKIPLNQGDLRENNRPLPMQYQSSLGTIDVIIGYRLKLNKMSVDIALQQPLTGRNRNTFLPEYWNTEAAYKYSPSNDFKRKGDVLLSYGFQFISTKKWNWQASVLGIYHLNEDTYIDANKSISPIKLTGSKGLTINLASKFLVSLSNHFYLGATVAAPLVVRQIRPDGLTRSFIFSPVLNFNF